MKVTGEIEVIRQERWADPKASWGLVPTMGYLHDGHLSLVRRARVENDFVVVSIFVNPTQFAPDEDLESYPRDLDRDLALLRDCGVDLVFIPTNETMYPEGFQTTVQVSKITRLLEGRSRPTHFEGVTTIVTKLFNIIQPTKAYFGQKDAQQAIVIQRLVEDLNQHLELVICPIIREPDGLAMSSRNVRLKPAERSSAEILYKSLMAAKKAYQNGKKDADELRKLVIDMIGEEPLARLDYVSIADPSTLQELSILGDEALISLAVFFGDVRLIDNMLIP